MSSINQSFKLTIKQHDMNIKQFLSKLSDEHHMSFSYWYLTYLLNHPEKLSVDKIRAFTDVLNLNSQEQRDLFL